MENTTNGQKLYRQKVFGLGKALSMWKAIQNFPNYKVNECGEVFSLRSKKLLRKSASSGYFRVGLMRNGIRYCFPIHRLVAEAFVENPNKLPCVNHKDENKLNNNASNLEWCSYQYNNTYHQRHLNAGLKLRKPVSQFDFNGRFIETYDSVKTAAKKTGMREQSIARAARGERKTYGGFIWKWCHLEQSESLRIR